MPEAKPTPNQKLRYERERRGWSQQDVADKVGTTPLNVGRWERGVTLPGPHFRVKLSEVFEKSPSELDLVSHLDASLSSEPVAITLDRITTVSEAYVPLWNVPYNRNHFFTGREEILMQLHAALLSKEHPVALAQPQAISGLGGIGKTQTAIEYAYRYRENYNAVFWTRADSHDLLVSDFLLIASLLNLPERNEQEQSHMVNAVRRWFDTHEQWLLILDNADNLTVVREFLPSSGKGHVLLTTRSHAMGTLAERIELEKMGIEEGVSFLLRRAKLLKGVTSLPKLSEVVLDHARAIVEAVDGLPLALDQAGAYIEDAGCTLSDYLKFYKTRRSRLLRMRGRDASGHPEPVATTWSLSFEKVERANPAAAELLRLCAFLHPDEIPEALLREGASTLEPTLRPTVEDEMELNEAIGELRKYSLVKRDPELKLLNLHRLVQVVVKDAMNKEAQQQWVERTVRMVNQAFPEAALASWPKCQQYLPHAQVCAESVVQWSIMLPEAAQLLSRVGNYLRQRAQYIEAEPLLKQALAIRKQVPGVEQLEIATGMNDLADLYVDIGKYVQADELYQQVRSIRETVLGLTHPDVATTLNDLGLLYREQGKFKEAEQLFEQALTIYKQTIGSEHLEVASSLNNLAVVQGDQGNYTSGELPYMQALAIWERLLGFEHPNVAMCLNNIGWLYYRQGRYDLVEAPHRRALAIREKVLGPNHPDVAMSLNALGLLYRDRGKYIQAEPFLQRALVIREQALGPDHVDVGQSLHNLGVLYYRQGKYNQAEHFLERSLDIREQLGVDNPIVAYSLNSLAILYRDQGKYEKAEELLQRALTIREQALEKESVDTSYTYAALAVLYHRQGKYAEAEMLFQRALTIQEQALDPNHPNLAQCLNDLAVLYSEQSKYSQAEPLLQRALSIREQVLGVEHPDVASTIANYVQLLRKTDREAEALKLETHIHAVRAQQE